MLDRFTEDDDDRRHCTYATRSPLGDHAGDSHRRLAGVNGRRFEPSAPISQIREQAGLPQGPPLTQSKATCEPSGDQEGL